MVLHDTTVNLAILLTKIHVLALILQSSFYVCLQQISNGHESPGIMYPELGATITKFLRREIGDQPILPKQPRFRQDFEHILDVVGINTAADLQCKYNMITQPLTL